MQPQSRKMSMMEAVTNVVLGYALAVLTQMATFPLFGLKLTLQDNMMLGALFTVVSVLRSYTLRRFFERLRIRDEARG